MGLVLHEHGHRHGHNHSHDSVNDSEAGGEEESHSHGSKVAVLCYVVRCCALCPLLVRLTHDGMKNV